MAPATTGRTSTTAALAAACLLTAVVMPSSAAAEEADNHRLSWDFPRFHTVEYGVTAALFVELAFIEFRTSQPDQPRWSGPIPVTPWGAPRAAGFSMTGLF